MNVMKGMIIPLWMSSIIVMNFCGVHAHFLLNYCAHHSMVVGMTSSVVIPDNRDSADVLPDNTNFYSRLYALKKILPQEDANMLAIELERLISRAKIDVYKMNILPADWKDLYDRILFL